MQIITRDLFEAAYLLAKGMRATKAFGGREAVLLLFEGDEKLGILKSQYRQGFAEVNVKAFRKEMKQIRYFVRQFMDTCRYTNGEETMSLDLTHIQETKNDVLKRDNPTSENFRFSSLSQTVRA